MKVNLFLGPFIYFMSYKTLSLKKIPENNRIFHSPLLSYKKIFPVKKKEIILNDYRRIKNLFFH